MASTAKPSDAPTTSGSPRRPSPLRTGLTTGAKARQAGRQRNHSAITQAIANEAPWILVVEDDPDISDLLLALFCTEGLRAIPVGDAETALKVARRYHPHAITLDLGLPGRDGHQLLHDLKRAASTRNIPVIVVSACPDQLCPEDADLLAAVVDKPFELGELLSITQRTLGTD